MHTLLSHGSTFIFVFSIFYPFLSLAVDTITPTQPLTINQTLVSSGEVFELGFFNTSNGNLYIGIWYKQIQQKTYVWVANRDTPITSSSGKLTIVDNGKMVLVDKAETAVWSSNQSTVVTNTVAQLLDNGNFVLRQENDENPENYIWQSFDYPTDTLLPEMKLGWDRKSGLNRFLRSWKTNDNPATGDYSFKLNISGFPEILALNNENIIWRTGPWNGRRFSGMPEMKGVDIMQFEFQENPDEIIYSFGMLNGSIYSRVVINSFGLSQRFVWAEGTKAWNVFWSFPGGSCDQFGECGPFGVCDANTAPICSCMTGFRPKNKQAWDLRDGKDGCVRSSELDCGSDGFLPLKNVKLPESSKAFVDRTMNLSECGEICKRKCSCAAYANMDITEGGSGCVIWEMDLTDMRQYADSEDGGQDLYVRVAASDLEESPTTRSSKSSSSSGNKGVKLVAIIIGVFVVLILLIILFYLKRRKIRWFKKSEADRKDPQKRAKDFLLKDGMAVPNRREYYREPKTDEVELPLFDFATLAIATNNFSDSSKLGEGGFGCVYKGILKEGEVVAVKRLSSISDQGIEELKNEVRLIAKLQHRNLVRLLGCCIEAKENGYMSPEYAMHGHFSTKSDVYSFGVLVLEILSGRRNTGSCYTTGRHNLLGQTWTLWKEGKALELLDKSIRADISENEVLRCIQIGLLCVQENLEDRPDMSKVSLLLSSETVQKSLPKYPGFFIRKENSETEFSSKQDDSITTNEITISILHGR
ncbi:hypothetical protein L1887_37504 [Cichorium endivia]|nr:hypothetical protein L1887_37504 [Cichorium endivia]